MHLFRFKHALLSLLFLWQTAPQPPGQPFPPFNHFRYQRGITVPSDTSEGEACAILDGDLFAHAAPALKDLRLYSGTVELPYSTTVSEPAQQDSDDASVLNLRAQSGHLAFDLEMPHRPYTTVILDLASHDYIATAVISGIDAPSSRKSVSLGTFTLFDLTSQHLSHNTSIPLSESAYPYLHIELAFRPVAGSRSSAASLNLPASVKSASVPPSREAQSLYTAIEQEKSLLQAGDESTATFTVQARVPVERIAFTLPSGYKGSFSRAVRIEARGVTGDGPGTQHDPDTGTVGSDLEDATGTILLVRKSERGRDLSAESLTIPVAIGSNMQRPASVAVHVLNGPDKGPDASLPLSVTLQMRQRRICFDAASASKPLTLYYGDPSLEAPAYKDAAFNPATAPHMVRLEPETLDQAFNDTPSPRKVLERPILRWMAILGCVCIFALLVIRSAHKRRR